MNQAYVMTVCVPVAEAPAGVVMMTLCAPAAFGGVMSQIFVLL
jgi:hypothetical protein